MYERKDSATGLLLHYLPYAMAGAALINTFYHLVMLVITDVELHGSAACYNIAIIMLIDMVQIGLRHNNYQHHTIEVLLIRLGELK